MEAKNKKWFEIWLTEAWDGGAWNGGKPMLLAKVRSKSLAYSVAKLFKEIYKDCIEIK